MRTNIYARRQTYGNSKYVLFPGDASIEINNSARLESLLNTYNTDAEYSLLIQLSKIHILRKQKFAQGFRAYPKHPRTV